MRRLAMLAASLTCACSMPDLPEGYQLQCYEDADCLEGTSCQRGCCVHTDETPACLISSWRQMPAGGPCTSDEQCAQGLVCYSEAQFGPVGGLCSRPCASASCTQSERCLSLPALAARAGLESDQFCAPQCWGSSNNQGCRPGYRCACATEGNCGCLPACNQSGDGACDADPDTGLPRSCSADTGLCVAAQ